MNRLLTYLKMYKKESILGPLFKLFEAILELMIPLLIGLIVNKGINGSLGKEYIISLSLLMVLFGLIGLVFSVVAQYYSAKAATNISKKLREQLYSKCLSFSFSKLDTIGTSKLITIITSDVNQVQNGVNLFLRLFLRSPFVVVGAMIMSFVVSWKVGFVFLEIITILLIVVFYVLNKTKKGYVEVQEDLDNVTLSTRQNLQGARVLRAFCKEEDEKQQFSKKIDSLSSKQKRVSILSSLLNPLTYSIVNVGIVFVLWIAAREVNSKILLQGDVLSLSNYMSQILVELIKFAHLVITISKSLACAKRISSILDIEENPNEENSSVNDNNHDEYIVFDDVSFMYDDAQDYALKNISFKVKKNSKVGIIGGTGSGKTSLVNLIGRFYNNQLGKIYFDGKNINDYSPKELRERIGFVFQKSVLFKGTIRSNLLWRKKDAKEEELLDALEVAQGLEIIMKKQNFLDAIVEQNGSNYSGGQKQRLAIARALVGNPEILVLDDSSSALDFMTDLKLRTAISNMKNSPTTFIVSQRTSSVMNADLILVMDNGYIVGKGTHEQLLNNCTTYKEIYDSQFKKGDEI